jgi:hypothetical protein
MRVDEARWGRVHRQTTVKRSWGSPVGYSRKRVGKSGKPRYTAYYLDLRGKERSAGTYGSEKQADKAWQRAETKIAEGRGGDPARGRQTFQRYVEVEWLPHHQMEPTTREGYTYSIYAHIMDTFAPMRMREICRTTSGNGLPSLRTLVQALRRFASTRRFSAQSLPPH